MLLNVWQKGLQLFKAKSDGKIDTAKPIPLTIGGQAVTNGSTGSYNLINGPKGEIYVLHTNNQGNQWNPNQGPNSQGNQTKVQLYTLGAIQPDANNKRTVPMKGGEFGIGSGNSLYSDPIKTDTAMFFDVESSARKKFLRLFNGALS